MDILFNEWLQDELKKRGLTQSELARRAGMSRQSISDYINQKRLPNRKAIVAIAKTFSIDVETLLSAAGLMQPPPRSDAISEEINHMVRGLTPEARDQVADFIRYLYEKGKRIK